MVLYAYRCSIGGSIERFFRMGEAPDAVVCEDHGTPARRQLSAGARVAFPGSYRFDHRSS